MTRGFREVLAVAERSKEDTAKWTAFLRHPKEGGLKGVRLFLSDKSSGLVEIFWEFYPEGLWQRCANAPLSQRVDGSAHKQVEGSSGDAESHSRAGRSHGGTTEAEQVAVKKDTKLAEAGAIVAARIEEEATYSRVRTTTGGGCGRTTR